MTSKTGERDYRVLPPRPILPRLNSPVIGDGKPRWDPVGTKEKDPISNRGMLYVLHGCDIGPITTNVTQPDLFRALAEIGVDI